MRQDLDRLMKARGLAGMVVIGADRYSPAMHYVTGQKLHVAMYFRGAGGIAHLIHDPMERDQASQVGCDTSTFPQQGFVRLLDQEGSTARAWGRLIAQTCATLGIAGPVAVFGEMPAGQAHAMLARAVELDPQISIFDSSPDILNTARTTKDAPEIEAIRRSSQGAVSAMNKAHAFLASLKRDGDRFLNGGTRPATLGDVRRLIQAEFLVHGLAETDGDSIVSQGRDAGVPHNRGNDEEPLRAGTPILIDIFPGEVGGGYCSDMTRTYCLGAPPEPLKKLYDDVWAAFRVGMEGIRLGDPCRKVQDLVCDVFEQRGHATRRTNETTEVGYVHNLGHGVGLSVHEGPLLGGAKSNVATIEPGMALTVEPGLYYPAQSLGLRIEDLVITRPDGSLENLTAGAPYELVIEPRG